MCFKHFICSINISVSDFLFEPSGFFSGVLLQESIDDLKEFMDKETNKSSYSVSMEGQLYDFGSYCRLYCTVALVLKY